MKPGKQAGKGSMREVTLSPDQPR